MGVSASKVIEVTNLVKSYGTIKAVDQISFEVAQGEVFGMLGPNGAGKTTTVEIVEGLRPADGGSATVLGIDVSKDSRAVKERIGVQPQSPALFPSLTVRETIRFFRQPVPQVAPHIADNRTGLAAGEPERPLPEPLGRPAAAPLGVSGLRQ